MGTKSAGSGTAATRRRVVRADRVDPGALGAQEHRGGGTAAQVGHDDPLALLPRRTRPVTPRTSAATRGSSTGTMAKADAPGACRHRAAKVRDDAAEC